MKKPVTTSDLLMYACVLSASLVGYKAFMNDKGINLTEADDFAKGFITSLKPEEWKDLSEQVLESCSNRNDAGASTK